MKVYKSIIILLSIIFSTMSFKIESQEIRFGVAFEYHGDEAITEAPLMIPLVQGAGIQTIKFYIWWSDIEPIEGDYNWEYVDAQLSEALAYGIDPYFCFGAITNSPSWVDISNKLVYAQKKAVFLSAFANRYRGIVKYYVVEGEPGNSSFYTWETYEIYREVVSILASAVRSNDSNAQIVGLGSDLGSAEGPKILYQALHDQALCDLFDIIELHIYPKPDPDGHPPTGYPTGYPNSTAVLFGKMRDNATKIMIGEHCKRTDHDALLSHVVTSKSLNEYEYTCVNSDCSSGATCCTEAYHCNKPIWLDYGVRSNLIDWCDPTTPQCPRYPYFCDFDDIYLDQDEEYRLALSSMFGGYEGILDGYNSVDRIYLFRINDVNEYCGKFGLITSPGDNPKPSYYAVKEFIKDVRLTRAIYVDSTASQFISLVEGTGGAYASGAVNGGPDDAQDNAWTAINDYLGFTGVNAIVAHPSTENALWAGLHISGLQSGATYSVNVRFVTTPNQPAPMGARVSVPDQIEFKELYQGVQEYMLVREMNSGGTLLQEREVFIGNAVVDEGEIVLYVNDEGGSIVFDNANVTGFTIRSNLAIPRQLIFEDGFESGDSSAWSEEVVD